MRAKGGRKVIVQILVEPDEGLWVAHALDFDLVASGESSGEAIEQIEEVIQAYFDACAAEGLTFDETKRPAGKEYFERFQQVFLDPSSEAWIGKISVVYNEPSNDRGLALV